MRRLKKCSEIQVDNSCSFLNQFNKKSQQLLKHSEQHLINKQKNQYNLQNSNTGQSYSETQTSVQQSSENKNSNKCQKQPSLASQINPQKQSLTLKKRKSNQKPTQSTKQHIDEILKKLQQQCSKNEDYYQNNEQSISLPTNILIQLQNKKTKNKKYKHKFFNLQLTDDQYNNQLHHQNQHQLKLLQQQHYNLKLARNQKNILLIEIMRNNLEQKVNKIRERMEFKNAHDDIRYKLHVKGKMEDVKDCEEVDIMLEAPKIFKGAIAAHTDATLYLKNTTQSPMLHSSSYSEDSMTQESKQKEQKVLNKEKNKKNIDRKQFYQQLNRQIKQTKAVQLTTPANTLFKTSTFDELKDEFQKNQHLFKEQTNSRFSLKSNQHSKVSLEKNRKSAKQYPNLRTSLSSQSQHKITEFSLENANYQQNMTANKKSAQPANQVQLNVQPQEKKNIQHTTSLIEVPESQEHETKQSKTDEPQPKSDNNPQKSKPQLKQQKDDKKQQLIQQKEDKKPQKKTKSKQKKLTKQQKFNIQIKQLFQLQAEYSSDENGNEDESSSQDGDDDTLQSLVDRGDVEYIVVNQKNAIKKYVEEQLKQDQKLMAMIKQKITHTKKIKCDQNTESNQRRRRRIQQAKKKYEQQDKDSQNQQIDNTEHKQKQHKEQNIDDFEIKLKDLQNQICNKDQFNHIYNSNNNNVSNNHHIGIFNKNKHFIWNNIKSISKQIKQDKRGGFVNNNKVIKGSKVQVKNCIKKKNINF